MRKIEDMYVKGYKFDFYGVSDRGAPCWVCPKGQTLRRFGRNSWEAQIGSHRAMGLTPIDALMRAESKLRKRVKQLLAICDSVNWSISIDQEVF